MPLEWDPDKEKSNYQKHGVSFEDVAELFNIGTDFLEIFDTEHSDDEDRFIAIGPTRVGIVVVAFTEREDDVIRIISARKATKKEMELFHKHTRGSHE